MTTIDQLFADELAEKLAEIDEMIATHTDEVRHHEAEAADIVKHRATPARERLYDNEPDPRGAKKWSQHTRDAEFARLVVADLTARRMRLLVRGAKRVI